MDLRDIALGDTVRIVGPRAAATLPHSLPLDPL